MTAAKRVPGYQRKRVCRACGSLVSEDVAMVVETTIRIYEERAEALEGEAASLRLDHALLSEKFDEVKARYHAELDKNFGLAREIAELRVENVRLDELAETKYNEWSRAERELATCQQLKEILESRLTATQTDRRLLSERLEIYEEWFSAGPGRLYPKPPFPEEKNGES